MLIKVSKNNDEIETRFVSDDGIETNFDYIKMLNLLYNKEHIELSFENVESELQEEIRLLFAELKSIQQSDEESDLSF